MNTRSQLPDDPLSGGKLCVYCGKAATSEDHAPPRCLLRKPRPSNLITLPACQECNSGFSFEESVVRMILAFVSSHPELVAERGPGGRIHRALERDRKLRGVRERSVQAGDGNYALTDEVFSSFQRVFTKTVQGLFFGLYDRVVPQGELTLDVIDNRRSVSPDQIANRYRPSPLEDITDKPLSAITIRAHIANQHRAIAPATPIGSVEAFVLMRELRAASRMLGQHGDVWRSWPPATAQSALREVQPLTDFIDAVRARALSNSSMPPRDLQAN